MNPDPEALAEAGIQTVIAHFRSAAERAVEAGFRVIEIHAAHGYLLHEFLSPLSNWRTDRYGGSLKNRTRLLREIAATVRSAIPDDSPLFVRISATDWLPGGWDLEQSISLARNLQETGVDLIDVSSGALVPGVTLHAKRGFQVPFAEMIRKQSGIRTGAVGLIIEPQQANEIIASGAAEIVSLATEMLREPYWAHKAYEAFGREPEWPQPYGYAIKRQKRD
jgi:2,4-dienoyl-CoA reductase (NADPH2)